MAMALGISHCHFNPRTLSLYIYVCFDTDWSTGASIFIADRSLRYMYNPPKDGVSIDHYKDFYSNLDVHYSSG